MPRLGRELQEHTSRQGGTQGDHTEAIAASCEGGEAGGYNVTTRVVQWGCDYITKLGLALVPIPPGTKGPATEGGTNPVDTSPVKIRQGDIGTTTATMGSAQCRGRQGL